MKCPYRRSGEHGWHPLNAPWPVTSPFLTVTWGCVCGVYKEVQHDLDFALISRGGREKEEEAPPETGSDFPVQDLRPEPEEAAEGA